MTNISMMLLPGLELWTFRSKLGVLTAWPSCFPFAIYHCIMCDKGEIKQNLIVNLVTDINL